MGDFMKKLLLAALLVVFAGQSHAPMTWKSGLQLTDGSTRDRVNITADDISINGMGFRSVSLTADLTVSGVNGLDTGTQANGTWYALHIITNNRGSQIASLFSLSATAPAFPATYTQFRRVSWHRNNGSGDLYRFTNAADDDWFHWNENISVGDFLVINVATSAIVYTDISCAAVAPPTCREVRLHWDLRHGAARTNLTIYFRNNAHQNIPKAVVTGFGDDDLLFFEGEGNITIDGSQILEYRAELAVTDTRIGIWAYKDIR